MLACHHDVCCVQVVEGINGPNKENSAFLPGVRHHQCAPQPSTGCGGIPEAGTEGEWVTDSLLTLPASQRSSEASTSAWDLDPSSSTNGCDSYPANLWLTGS